MPSKTKKVAAATASLPPIPKELIDQFGSGPMSGEAVNAATLAFKKALIERALGNSQYRPIGDSHARRKRTFFDCSPLTSAQILGYCWRCGLERTFRRQVLDVGFVHPKQLDNLVREPAEVICIQVKVLAMCDLVAASRK